MSEKYVNLELLKEFYLYNYDTGAFYHAKDRLFVRAGTIAGSKDGNGYMTLTVSGKKIKSHRAAWFLTYGYLPEKFIDHIDGNRTNNAILNLRLVDRVQNAQNMRKAKSNSPSGLIGAFRHKHKWRSQIVVNKKTINLGCFNTAEEAHQAYIKAKRSMHPYGTI